METSGAISVDVRIPASEQNIPVCPLLAGTIPAKSSGIPGAATATSRVLKAKVATTPALIPTCAWIFGGTSGRPEAYGCEAE
jgi:hypothetical protein